MALGVEALDAGVDVRSLILVDPAGWDPFGQSVGIDPAGPAFLQEMGVVITAEQGEVVQIARPAQNPVEDVVSVAPLRGMGAAREAAAAVSGNQSHGLTFGRQPPGSA